MTRKNRALGVHLVSLGTTTSTLASPREVFRVALLTSRATGILVVHSHPSGDPAPSSADISLTRQLRDAATTLSVELLDHIVIGSIEGDPTGKGFYSFRAAGFL